jgi:hypothetical protein
MVVTGVGTGGSQGHQTLLISMRNTGNSILKPTGTIRVDDAAGHRVQLRSYVLDSFLSWTAIDYPVLVQGKTLGVGCYQATVLLHYADAMVAHYTGQFCVTQKDLDQVYAGVPPLVRPPPAATSSMLLVLVIGVAVAIVLLMGFLFWLTGFRRRRRAAVAPATA